MRVDKSLFEKKDDSTFDSTTTVPNPENNQVRTIPLSKLHYMVSSNQWPWRWPSYMCSNVQHALTVFAALSLSDRLRPSEKRVCARVVRIQKESHRAQCNANMQILTLSLTAANTNSTPPSSSSLLIVLMLLLLSARTT